MLLNSQIAHRIGVPGSQHNAVLAALFAFVQRIVRPADTARQAFSRRIENSHTKCQRDAELQPLVEENVVIYIFSQQVGHFPGTAQVDAWQKDQELFPAPARQAVKRAQLGLHQLRCRHQHIIAAVMTVAVIEGFEVIHVTQQDRERALRWRGNEQPVSPTAPSSFAGLIDGSADRYEQVP
jgi:hypothetical protein